MQMIKNVVKNCGKYELNLKILYINTQNKPVK